jgi:hypothetical protein
LNGIREELESLREASQTQRKRFLDMILVLLRDVGDIGSIMGGQMNEQKVFIFQRKRFFIEICFSRNQRLKILIKLKKNLH